MIPEGHTIEDIKTREKKHLKTRCLSFAPYAWRSLRHEDLFYNLEQAVDDRFDNRFHLVVSIWTRMEFIIQTVVRM